MHEVGPLNRLFSIASGDGLGKRPFPPSLLWFLLGPLSPKDSLTLSQYLPSSSAAERFPSRNSNRPVLTTVPPARIELFLLGKHGIGVMALKYRISIT